MKICIKCNIEKDLTKFSKHRNGYQSSCKECHSIYLKKHYSDNKGLYIDRVHRKNKILRDMINEAKNKPCLDCKISYPFYVMDLDHREGTDKKFNLSDYNSIGSIEKISLELEKVDAVCANCHRERTYKRMSINI